MTLFKIYYGIYNNNINNINQYEKKDNDQFCSRFQWYGSESYLDVIIPKQDTDTDKKIIELDYDSYIIILNIEKN